MSNGQGVEEIPQGVPGRVYICEWCGHYWNNWVPYGEMKWCPNCGKGMLRKDCAKCGTPIPFPPQWKCYSCGEWLTIMPMIEVAPGEFVHSGDRIAEPDVEHRKQLEAKGNNWYDVVRGKAEGPDPELPDVAPPRGWTAEEFARLMQQAHGAEPPTVESHMVFCDHCKIKLRYIGEKQQIEEVFCAICQGPVKEWPFTEGQQPQPPTPEVGPDGIAEGLDNLEPPE